jgi:hypothetical protein
MRTKSSRFRRIVRVRLRRLVRGLDRRLPAWAHDFGPWGTSVLLHALLLLILALILYARSGRGDEEPAVIEANTLLAGQLTEDLTSLAPSDHSGDPFSTLKTDEPPSLVLDSAKLDPNRINTPQLPPSVRLGADLKLDSVEFSPDRSQLGATGLGMKIGIRSAPFSGRQGDAKAKLLRREGGTVESEKAVEIGLDWLARHQRPDGSWGMDTSPQCREPGCPVDKCVASDTAATGLALLPFLGAGITHVDPNRYQGTVKKGLSWLLTHQARDGDLYTGGLVNGHLYSHAIGTMALCEAYGITKDKRLRDPAQKAINFIIRAQNPFDGGWRYEPGMPGDTSVFGWQLFALRSGRLAGLTINKATIRRAREYLDRAAADDFRTTYSYMPGRRPTPVMTAEALLGRQILGWERNYPPMLKGAAQIAAHLEMNQERNIYYWYYATQMLHNLKGPTWEQWNHKLRDHLVATQTTGEGCDRGSWDPINPAPDEWGKSAGRLYQTTLSMLTLEVYYRYLPLYRDEKHAEPDDPEPSEDDAKATEVNAPAGGEK